MEKLTAEQIAERIAKSVAKRPPHEHIDNTVLVDSSGLRVVHILPEDCLSGKGLTVAWRPDNKPVIEISTALCKRGDTFSRKMGTKTAIENFLTGRTVYVPLIDDDPVLTARLMFAD